MKNPLISRLLSEDDVVPVIANVPRETYRNRMVKKRQIEDEDDSVARMVGEAVEDDEKKSSKDHEKIIPDNAEDVDTTEIVVGKPLKAPKEIVQEPSHPSGDKEKYLTPYSALTAPDVTPQATQPIDPNQVPGRPGPEKFTAADLERAQPVQGGEVAAKAMDVLLGRNRSKPTPEEGEGEREMFDRAGATVTEEQAAAMMGVSPVQENAAAKAASMMVAAKDGGNGMPDPQPISDGSKIYSAFRRFTG